MKKNYWNFYHGKPKLQAQKYIPCTLPKEHTQVVRQMATNCKHRAIILQGAMFQLLQELDDTLEEGYKDIFDKLAKTIKKNEYWFNDFNHRVKMGVLGNNKEAGLKYFINVYSFALKEMRLVIWQTQQKISQSCSKNGLGEHRNILAQLSVPIIFAALIEHDRQTFTNDMADYMTAHYQPQPTHPMQKVGLRENCFRDAIAMTGNVYPPNVKMRPEMYVDCVCDGLGIDKQTYFKSIEDAIKPQGGIVGGTIDVFLNKLNAIYTDDFVNKINEIIDSDK